MDGWWLDARQALRGLLRDAGFTATTVLTLAVGIGLNAAVFSVVHAVLLAPLPYPDADRLAVVWTAIPAEGVTEATSAYANVQDWRAQNRTFEDLATFDPTTLALGGYDAPEQVMTIRASANLFDIMAVSPRVGRAFTADEVAERSHVAVASSAFADQRFGSADAALGSTVELGGLDFEIVGVMPDGLDTNASFWLPQTLFTDWDAQSRRRGTDAFQVLGRLRPGVEIGEARSDLDAIAARLESEHAQNAGLGVRALSYYDQVTGSSLRLALWAVFAAVGVVLLIACANAAHLTIARGIERSRDVAVRTALGASTPRLVRQALTESLLIAGAAAALGAALARVALPTLMSFAPAGMPRAADVAMSGPVFGYLLLVSVVVALLCGIVPIAARSRADIHRTLRAGRSTTPNATQRARKVLVTGQLALAVVLVFTASLIVRSFAAARRVDPGFAPEGLLIANLSVQDEAERSGFYESVVESVGALSGVEAAGVIEDLFIGGAPNRSVSVEGRDADLRTEIRIDAIGGDLLTAIDVPLLAGRAFDARDAADTEPVAIVNETMAARFWPGESAVGKRFRTGASAPWTEVVGMMADMRRQGPERAPIAQVFVPYAQAPSRNMNLLVRTDAAAAVMAAPIRERVAAANPNIPVSGYGTVVASMDRYVTERRLQTLLFGIFSSLALALAALGIYGLVQYSVASRTRELSLRVALGAYAGELQRMVVRETLALALPGLVLGVAASVWVAEAVGALLFAVTPGDSVSVAVTAGTLLLATLLASYLPARRASRVDPMESLRSS